MYIYIYIIIAGMAVHGVPGAREPGRLAVLRRCNSSFSFTNGPYRKSRILIIHVPCHVHVHVSEVAIVNVLLHNLNLVCAVVLA